jgi:hypothetical protein
MALSALSLAKASSISTRDETTSLCLETDAAILAAIGRLSKYVSDSPLVIRSILPSIRTWRSSAFQ